MLTFLLLGVIQVGVYLHIRNVAVSSAAQGARFAANANVPTEQADEHAKKLMERGVGESTANNLACTSSNETDSSGLSVVKVHCVGALPVFFAPLGELIPIDISARAVDEETS